MKSIALMIAIGSAAISAAILSVPERPVAPKIISQADVVPFWPSTAKGTP
jgi:hypothetical protein